MSLKQVRLPPDCRGGGRRTQLTYPTDVNLAIQYEYDADDRVTAVKRGQQVLAQYTYDKLGRRDYVALGNGTSRTYTYDIGNRLLEVVNGLTGDQEIRFAYTQYDKVGNRLKLVQDGTQQYTYAHDSLYQRTKADYPDDPNVAYAYDLVGNRTQVITGQAWMNPYA